MWVDDYWMDKPSKIGNSYWLFFGSVSKQKKRMHIAKYGKNTNTVWINGKQYDPNKLNGKWYPAEFPDCPGLIK